MITSGPSIRGSRISSAKRNMTKTHGLMRKSRQYPLLLLIIVSINFIIPRVMPGDPFLFLSTDDGSSVMNYSQAELERYIAYYGFDRPLAVQYLSYLSGIARMDLGYSIHRRQPVAGLVLRRAGWTVSLVAVSLVIGSVVGTVLGAALAWFGAARIDRIGYGGALVLNEVPSFILAIILLFAFGVIANLFPLSGGMSHYREFAGVWAMVADRARHAVLPVASLAFGHLAGFFLLARATVVTITREHFIQTARSRGLGAAVVFVKHVLPHTFLPAVTRFFFALGIGFGGALLVESVFRYPGIGVLVQEAVFQRDYPVLQGAFLFIACSVLLANAAAELLYSILDPRVGRS